MRAPRSVAVPSRRVFSFVFGYNRRARLRQRAPRARDHHRPSAEHGEHDLRRRRAPSVVASRAHREIASRPPRAARSRGRAFASRRRAIDRGVGRSRRVATRTCSSFQLLGFVGSFHGYGTLGGAFGSLAYDRRAIVAGAGARARASARRVDVAEGGVHGVRRARGRGRRRRARRRVRRGATATRFESAEGDAAMARATATARATARARRGDVGRGTRATRGAARARARREATTVRAARCFGFTPRARGRRSATSRARTGARRRR